MLAKLAQALRTGGAKLNRKGLAREISKKTKLSVQKAENLVIAFGAVVTDVLEKQEKIIYSNFGTFYTVHYPSKTIYHPKFGKKKTMVMLPTNAAKWMPSGNIKKMVNDGIDVEEPTRHKAKKITNEDLQVVSKEKTNPTKTTDTKERKEVGVSHVTKNYVENPQKLETDDSSKATHTTNKLNEIEDLEEYQKAKSKLINPNLKETVFESSKKDKPKKIYEETLSDGSRELSTVDGSIKLHNDRDDHKMDDIVSKNKELENEKKDKKDDKHEGALDRLKSKLGLGHKDNEKDDVSEAVQQEQPSGDKRKENCDDDDLECVNLAEAGIFGTESIKDLKAKIEPKTNGEKRIDKIKDELEDGSKSDKVDSLSKSAEIEKPNLSLAREPINITYKDLTKIDIDKELLKKVPQKIARKYKSVPVNQKDGVVTVAMVDPQDVETKEILKRHLGQNLQIILATEADINHVLNQYQGLESEVSSAIEGAETIEDAESKKKDKEKERKKVNPDEISDDAPAAKIADSLLKRAIRDKASDIHIEPSEKEVEVRFRIDGVLKKKVSLPKDIQAAVVSRIKILSNLKIDEQRIPQDGRFNMVVDNRKVDFRVSSMPIASGEKIVMRILDKESGVLTIEQLGIQGHGKKVLENSLKKSHGMVLVTGPTGSGKSTTLYAMINKLYNVGINIVTLEDPIEYQIKGINQSQVNSEIGYTFATGLRSILRQDPDIIMLGEIRDKETAEMAVHAALTGHVLLSTLHTNTAAGAPPRMIDMGVEPFLLTSSINVIVAQRLVRKICEECKVEFKPATEILNIIKAELEKLPEDERALIKKKGNKFYQGKGCKACDDSGTKGRIGIYEVLSITDEIKELIQKRSSDSIINKEAISQGMVTLLQDGIIKALEGKIPLTEVWRVTKE